jgi:hypothetical protein
MFSLGPIWGRFKALLYPLIVVYLVVVAIYSWFFAPSEHKPHADDPCGPNNRWSYSWPPGNPDLSCVKSD